MASVTVAKTIGTASDFSTLQLWDDGAPVDLTTAEQSAAGTFAVASFVQGESLTFLGSGATGKFLHTDSTGPGTGSFVTYGITAGNPAASDVVTGGTSGATCILSSGTADFVGVIWQGKVQNEELSGAGGTRLLITGNTTSSTAYFHLTTVANASFRDNVNKQNNALRYNASNGAALQGTSSASNIFNIESNFARLTGLQFDASGANSRVLRISANSVLIEYCILEGTATASATTDGPIGLVNGSSIVFANCVLVGMVTGLDHIVGTGNTTCALYNCTIVAPDDLAAAPTSIFAGTSGTVTVQNCALFAGDSGSAIKTGAATYNFTTCYSDISGTGGVTQTTYSSEFENINQSTLDVRLKTGAAQINTGTTDAPNAAIDIVGTARPNGAAYDVGAWEFNQAVPTPITGLGRKFVLRPQ